MDMGVMVGMVMEAMDMGDMVATTHHKRRRKMPRKMATATAMVAMVDMAMEVMVTTTPHKTGRKMSRKMAMAMVMVAMVDMVMEATDTGDMDATSHQ